MPRGCRPRRTWYWGLKAAKGMRAELAEAALAEARAEGAAKPFVKAVMLDRTETIHLLLQSHEDDLPKYE